MADISAIFFILLIIAVAYPSTLTLLQLTFPTVVKRAQVRVEKTLGGTIWMGLILLIALTIPITILLALPFGPAKFFGWAILTISLAVSSVGAAGIAAHLGEQMRREGSNPTPLAGFIRGAVILELAAFLPILGWFFLLPIAIITSLGATGFALLNWMPRNKMQSATPIEAATTHA